MKCSLNRMRTYPQLKLNRRRRRKKISMFEKHQRRNKNEWRNTRSLLKNGARIIRTQQLWWRYDKKLTWFVRTKSLETDRQWVLELYLIGKLKLHQFLNLNRFRSRTLRQILNIKKWSNDITVILIYSHLFTQIDKNSKFDRFQEVITQENQNKSLKNSIKI